LRRDWIPPMALTPAPRESQLAALSGFLHLHPR